MTIKPSNCPTVKPYARRLPRKRGSVLMEYVILCCFVGMAAAFFTFENFYNVTDGYVGLGVKFVHWRQILLHALALPIP